MTEALGLPDSMLMPLDTAVARIMTAIRRREAFVAFPASTTWLVWLMRFLPGPLGDWLAGKMLQRARKLKPPA
jgi:hypothetical protein